MDTQAKFLIFHSTVVLLIGLLVGAFYGRAINRNAPPHIVNAWRLAHGSLPLGAALGLVIGAVMPALIVTTTVKTLLAWSFIVSNYAFCVSLPLGAVVGQRGLSRSGPASNQLVLVGNMVGAVTALAGAITLVYAAYVSLI